MEEVAVQSDEAQVESAEVSESTEVQVNPKEAFLSSLPEDFQTDPTFNKFNDVGELARSYKNVEKMVGADQNSVFKIPKDGDLSEVYSALGRPESADKYEVDALKDESFSSMIDPEVVSKVREVAYEKGVSNEALNAIMNVYKDDVQSQVSKSSEQSEKFLSESREAIQRELGAAFEERVAQIHGLQEKYGDEALSGLVEKFPQVFQSAPFVRFMAKIAPQFVENGELEAQSSGKLSPTEARMQIAELESQPDFMSVMQDKSNPKRKSMMAERDRLYKMANRG